MIDLNLPQYEKFLNDISSDVVNLQPLIIIRSSPPVFLSQNEETLEVNGHNRRFESINLKIPSIKESLDLETKKIKINNVSISFSNYKNFSNLFTEVSFIGSSVDVYWKSQSSTKIEECLLVYSATIRRLDHSNDSVKIILEDLTESASHSKVPISTIKSKDAYRKKDINKVIPMAYGRVSKAPCFLYKDLDQDTPEEKYIKAFPDINEEGIVSTGDMEAASGTWLDYGGETTYYNESNIAIYDGVYGWIPPDFVIISGSYMYYMPDRVQFEFIDGGVKFIQKYDVDSPSEPKNRLALNTGQVIINRKATSIGVDTTSEENLRYIDQAENAVDSGSNYLDTFAVIPDSTLNGVGEGMNIDEDGFVPIDTFEIGSTTNLSETRILNGDYSDPIFDDEYDGVRRIETYFASEQPTNYNQAIGRMVYDMHELPVEIITLPTPSWFISRYGEWLSGQSFYDKMKEDTVFDRLMSMDNWSKLGRGLENSTCFGCGIFMHGNPMWQNEAFWEEYGHDHEYFNTPEDRPNLTKIHDSMPTGQWDQHEGIVFPNPLFCVDFEDRWLTNGYVTFDKAWDGTPIPNYDVTKLPNYESFISSPGTIEGGGSFMGRYGEGSAGADHTAVSFWDMLAWHGIFYEDLPRWRIDNLIERTESEFSVEGNSYTENVVGYKARYAGRWNMFKMPNSDPDYPVDHHWNRHHHPSNESYWYGQWGLPHMMQGNYYNDYTFHEVPRSSISIAGDGIYTGDYETDMNQDYNHDDVIPGSDPPQLIGMPEQYFDPDRFELEGLSMGIYGTATNYNWNYSKMKSTQYLHFLEDYDGYDYFNVPKGTLVPVRSMHMSVKEDWDVDYDEIVYHPTNTPEINFGNSLLSYDNYITLQTGEKQSIICNLEDISFDHIAESVVTTLNMKLHMNHTDEFAFDQYDEGDILEAKLTISDEEGSHNLGQTVFRSSRSRFTQEQPVIFEQGYGESIHDVYYTNLEHIGLWHTIDNFNSCELKLEAVAASIGIAFNLNIYDIGVKHMAEVENFLDKDFYINTNGRNVGFGSNLVGIVDDIIERELDVVVSKDASCASVANFLEEGWTFAFSQTEKISSKTLFENMAESCPAIPFFRTTNLGSSLAFSYIKNEYNDDDVQKTIKAEDVIKSSFSRTKLEDVKTMVRVKYKKDYASGEYGEVTDWASPYDFFGNGDAGYMGGYKKTSFGFSPSNLGDSILEFESPYISDKLVAENLRNFLTLTRCNQNSTIRVKLPLTYIDLEISDIVKFDSLINGKKCYGEDYTSSSVYRNGQKIYPYFIVTSVNKSTKSVDVECLQLHRLKQEAIFPQGDVLRDGVFNEADLVEFENYLQGDSKYFTFIQKNIADINGDGVANSHDISLLVDALMALPPQIPPSIVEINTDLAIAETTTSENFEILQDQYHPLNSYQNPGILWLVSNLGSDFHTLDDLENPEIWDNLPASINVGEQQFIQIGNEVLVAYHVDQKYLGINSSYKTLHLHRGVGGTPVEVHTSGEPVYIYGNVCPVELNINPDLAALETTYTPYTYTEEEVGEYYISRMGLNINPTGSSTYFSSIIYATDEIILPVGGEFENLDDVNNLLWNFYNEGGFNHDNEMQLYILIGSELVWIKSYKLPGSGSGGSSVPDNVLILQLERGHLNTPHYEHYEGEQVLFFTSNPMVEI